MGGGELGSAPAFAHVCQSVLTPATQPRPSPRFSSSLSDAVQYLMACVRWAAFFVAMYEKAHAAAACGHALPSSAV